MTTRLVPRRAFVPLAGLALALFAVGIPTGSALAATPKPPTLDIWVVTATKHEKHEKPDGGRIVPPELATWGELSSDPLKEYTKFELVDHVTAPITKEKAHKYQIKGESSVFEIAFVGVEPDPKAKNTLLYSYRVTFPSPEGKAETLLRVTKAGERTIIRDRGYKHAPKAVRFFAVSVGP